MCITSLDIGCGRHWVNSILNWNCLFKNGMGMDKYLKLKFAIKQFNPQINLSFNFLIQKYFFHDNPTWNINYSK